MDCRPANADGRRQCADLLGAAAGIYWSGCWPNWVETGICYQRSEVTFAQISDGTSNTYMVGEKYLCSDVYTTGTDWGDDLGMYQGHDIDVLRWTTETLLPVPDQPGMTAHCTFGGPHPSGVQFVFADGSVHMILYSIDPIVHARLGNRCDGLPVDGNQF